MLNKAILIGNLGRDPEIRYTQAGTTVSTFSLATTEKSKGQDGQVKETTEWHNIVLWSKLAELAGEYLQKGSKVYIEGRIQTRKWQDQEGKDRYTTEIVGREIKFLSPRNESTRSDTQSHVDAGGGFVGDTGTDVPFLPCF